MNESYGLPSLQASQRVALAYWHPSITSGHLTLQTIWHRLLLAGGTTTNNFHGPLAEAANLRANFIAYTAGAVLGPVIPQVVPTLDAWGLVIMVLLVLGAVWMQRRRAQSSVLPT